MRRSGSPSVRVRRTVAATLGALLVVGASSGATQAVAEPAAAPAAVPTAVVAPATRAPVLGFALRKSGFGQAVQVTNSGDSTRRLFVVDRKGRVLVWNPLAPASIGLYLDLRSKVNASGAEQGLLSVAFLPSFKATPLVFVAYTRGDGALVVSRFHLAAYDQASVSPLLEQQMLVVPHPTYTNHNGGMLVFGKDRSLYISTGDGGGGDLPALAQSGRTLNGKILRVDVYHSCAAHPLYCIPPSNPLYGTSYKQEVWLVGLRNPWRFSVDQVTGALWIGDVGQNRYEELDVAAMNQGGSNFGWSCREGFAVYDASRCGPGAYTSPKFVIAHPAASALIGGVVYRGAKYQALMGPRYIVGDYVTGSVWTYAWNGPVVRAGQLPGVTSFGEDQFHEVLATTLDGGLYEMGAR